MYLILVCIFPVRSSYRIKALSSSSFGPKTDREDALRE
jgi:hypothetical protein